MGELRVALVDCLPDVDLKDRIPVSRFGEIAVNRVEGDSIDRYLHEFREGELAVVFVGGESSPPDAVRKLRAHRDFRRTRVYVVSEKAGAVVPGWAETYDVDDMLAPSAFSGFGFSDAVDVGLRAHRSLAGDPLYTDYYLDMTFNKIFDWFEATRWDWSEVKLDQVNPDLLREEERDFITEGAIIEFGTLPGAHNFLREWEGETSFSSWSLMWGAEEARHSLVQARYLDRIGVKLRSKHALYKRQPYPIGDTQAGTLMMNIISEARAAEYYKRLCANTEEPVIRRIWKLLHRDESRHARAFFLFGQELCDESRNNQIAALKMAYVWLADRSNGVKHPAGHFYPHATSAKGIKRVEQIQEGMTDAADARVFAMIRRIVDDDAIDSVQDIKKKLRSLMLQPS
jgi:hypothetical protein